MTDFEEFAAGALPGLLRGGVMTMWDAPSSVPLETVKGWAFAAAVHAGD